MFCVHHLSSKYFVFPKHVLSNSLSFHAYVHTGLSYFRNVLALLRTIEDAFSGPSSSRSEPHVHAERIVSVFDFTSYFADYAIPIKGITTAACFLFKKNAAGRTIVRTKAWSHMEGWNDDETVTLFHVGCIFCTRHVGSAGRGGGGGVLVHTLEAQTFGCFLDVPPTVLDFFRFLRCS